MKAQEAKNKSGLPLWAWIPAGLLLAAAQFQILFGTFQAAIRWLELAALVSALLLLAGWALNNADAWTRAMEGWRARRKAPGKRAAKARPGRREPVSRTAGPVPALVGPLELARLLWKVLGWWIGKLAPSTLVLRDWMLLALAAGLLVFGQISLTRKTGILTYVSLGLSLLLALLFLRLKYRLYQVDRLDERAKGLVLGLAALPFLFKGTQLLWQDEFVYRGFLVNAIGCALALWGLAKYRWLSLDDLQPDLARPSFTGNLMSRAAALLQSPAAKLVLLGAGVYCWIQAPQCQDNMTTIIMYAVSLVFFLAGLPLYPEKSVLDMWMPLRPRARGLISLGVFALATALAALAQARLAGNQVAKGSLLMLTAACVLSLAFNRPRAYPARSGPLKGWEGKAELMAFALLILAAFGLRFWHTGIFPYGIEGDEAGGGVWARKLLPNGPGNLFVQETLGQVYFAVTAFIFRFWDVSVLTTRMHSVIFGTLSVGGMYFLLRYFFGRAVSLVSTLLMAGGYWHLHFSRFGHYNIEQVMMQMVCFYFLLRGLLENKAWLWILAGLTLALAIQPHLASRLIPVILMAYLVFLAFIHPRVFAGSFNGVFLVVLSCWLMAAPVLTSWLRALPLSTGRAKSVSIFDKTNSNAPRDTAQGFLDNTRSSMLMFNVAGDTRSRNLMVAPRPVLETWTAAVFALALLWAFLTWRDLFHGFLLLCFLGNLCASVFSVEAPSALRTAGNIPIVACFIASLLARFKQALEEALSPGDGVVRARATGLAFLCLGLAFAGGAGYRSLHAYFVEFSNAAYDVLPTEIALDAKRMGPLNKTVFFATGFAGSHPPFLLYAAGLPLYNYYELGERLPLRETASNYTTTVALCDAYMAALPRLEACYPDAKASEVWDLKKSWLLYKRLLIGPADVKESHQIGYRALYASGQSLTGTTSGVQSPPEDPGLPSKIAWEGSLYIGSYGFWEIWGETSGSCRVEIDGKEISRTLGGKPVNSRRDLSVGMHTFKVLYRPKARESFGLHWAGRPVEFTYYWNLRGPVQGRIGEENFFKTLPGGGLEGSVFANMRFTGDVVIKRRDPEIIFHWLDPPIPQPFSMRWKGYLKVEKEGDYRFSLDTCAFSEVRVGKKRLWRSGIREDDLDTGPAVPFLHLKPGLVPLEVEFASHNCVGIDLKWALPDQALETIPYTNLFPPEAGGLRGKEAREN